MQSLKVHTKVLHDIGQRQKGASVDSGLAMHVDHAVRLLQEAVQG